MTCGYTCKPYNLPTHMLTVVAHGVLFTASGSKITFPRVILRSEEVSEPSAELVCCGEVN